MRRFRCLPAALLLIAVVTGGAPLACADAVGSAAQRDASPPSPARLRLKVIDRYPHDARAFTQGLLLRGSTLYESTGLHGRSSIREVDLATGAVRRQIDLPRELFGEGLAMVGEHLIQLTWTNGLARVYSLPQLALVREHRYDGEGWGLCFDGESLVMSDGSDRLFLRDPETFAIRRTVAVLDDSGPVDRLNELECVGRHVYANVWGSWRIVRVDMGSGQVDAALDATELLSDMEKGALPAEAVMNGIAYDVASDTFLLTGKLWPRIHRVQLSVEKIK